MTKHSTMICMVLISYIVYKSITEEVLLIWTLVSIFPSALHQQVNFVIQVTLKGIEVVFLMDAAIEWFGGGLEVGKEEEDGGVTRLLLSAITGYGDSVSL